MIIIITSKLLQHHFISLCVPCPGDMSRIRSVTHQVLLYGYTKLSIFLGMITFSVEVLVSVDMHVLHAQS